MKPTLKQKQAATKKHFARQFALPLAIMKPRSRKGVGGRPPSGSHKVQYWMPIFISVLVEELAAQNGVTPSNYVAGLVLASSGIVEQP